MFCGGVLSPYDRTIEFDVDEISFFKESIQQMEPNFIQGAMARIEPNHAALFHEFIFTEADKMIEGEREITQRYKSMIDGLFDRTDNIINNYWKWNLKSFLNFTTTFQQKTLAILLNKC